MLSLSDELNQKMVALVTHGIKVTPSLLAQGMQAYLSAQETAKQLGILSPKTALLKLQGKGTQLTNIEITDDNIKAFEK